MDGCIRTQHLHIVLFTCPFVLDLHPLTSGRHLNFSLIRLVKFSCLVFQVSLSQYIFIVQVDCKNKQRIFFNAHTNIEKIAAGFSVPCTLMISLLLSHMKNMSMCGDQCSS